MQLTLLFRALLWQQWTLLAVFFMRFTYSDEFLLLKYLLRWAEIWSTSHRQGRLRASRAVHLIFECVMCLLDNFFAVVYLIGHPDLERFLWLAECSLATLHRTEVLDGRID